MPRSIPFAAPGVRRGSLPAAALAVLIAGSSFPARSLAERYALPGPDVAIWNLAGSVEVVAGAGESVVVEVRRGGSAAGRLEVATGPIGGRQTLRVVYPSSRVKYRRDGILGWGSMTTLRVGKDGRFGDRAARFGGRRVSIGGSGLDAHADLRIAVPAGRKIAVYLAVGDVTASGLDGDILLDTARSNVTASDVRGVLTIDTGSGHVSASGIQGDLSVDTGSGSVNVSDVGGRILHVDTGSGSVSGSGVRVERLNVDTGSGAVDIADLRATDIRVDTGSGRVRLDLRSEIRSLLVDTGSGGVTVAVPDDLGAEVFIETGSGGIHSDVPMEVSHKRRDSLRGRIGDGRGRITIDTGSGGVRLTRS